VIRVQVKPELLDWAVARAGSRADYLRDRFDLAAWKSGEQLPTMKQLETFANAARVPIGYLFLDAPPVEKLPIPDLRTPGDRGLSKASPDLLDTLAICQQRQDWYKEYADAIGQDALDFIGSAKLSDPATRVADSMQKVLGFGIEERRAAASLDDSLRLFIEKAEGVGVLVMVSGIVGSNTTRVLDTDEFRGFALIDRLAPVVFINGADWKAAQIFTLAHELAHLWLGFSALSNASPDRMPKTDIELWCNEVAAELLVPELALRTELGDDDPLNELPNLAFTFRVSTLVILRRLRDARLITADQFWKAYSAEAAGFAARAPQKGGNYYTAHPYRLSKRFARAVITSAIEGGTLYRDAFQLLGVKSDSTFRGLGQSLQVQQ